MVALAVSVAVTVCAPALVRVTGNVPVPLVRVASAGSTTPLEVSLLVKCTVPEYEVTALPCAFTALTVTLNA